MKTLNLELKENKFYEIKGGIDKKIENTDKEDFRKLVEKEKVVLENPKKKIKGEKLEEQESLNNTITEKPILIEEIEMNDINELASLLSLIKSLVKDFKELDFEGKSLEKCSESLGALNGKVQEALEGLMGIDNVLFRNLMQENSGDLEKTLASFKEKLGQKNFHKGSELLLNISKELKNISKSIDESIIKILNKVEDFNLNKETLNLLANGDKKVVKDILVNIEKSIGDKDETISIKEFIKNLSKLNTLLNDKEGNENLNEEFKNKKPFDLMVKTSNETVTKTKNEEEVLSSIIHTDDNKANGDLTIFNKRLEALNKMDKSLEAPILRKSNIDLDLIKSIKFMQRDNIKELTVKVYPRDLGEIIISISKEDDLLKASLKANSKDTYNLIAQNAQDIKKLLGDGGIKISDIDISLYEDTTFYNESEFKRENNRQKDEMEVSFEGSDEIKEDDISREDDILNILA